MVGEEFDGHSWQTFDAACTRSSAEPQKDLEGSWDKFPQSGVMFSSSTKKVANSYKVVSCSLYQQSRVTWVHTWRLSKSATRRSSSALNCLSSLLSRSSSALSGSEAMLLPRRVKALESGEPLSSGALQANQKGLAFVTNHVRFCFHARMSEESQRLGYVAHHIHLCFPASMSDESQVAPHPRLYSMY